jgi:magnesium transporter
MLSVFVHDAGVTRAATAVDPDWLRPDSSVSVWADLADPAPEDAALLTGLFGFHELAVEDALAETHHPKVETYGDTLYLILHGIDFEVVQHRFATHDVDFFLRHNLLVTVHDGGSRSIARLREICVRNPFVLGEGPASLLHRIVDTMVDHYRPEVQKLEARIDRVEEEVFEGTHVALMQEIVALKKDVSSLRRVTLPQRDAIGRLARREFPFIGEQLGYRFRDVYDNLVRMSDEALSFHDRITSLLDAHLSYTSNRLNEVMKVLTIFATIFGPLTVLTGLYGMNVDLPHLPGAGEMQFWWVVGFMLLLSGSMLLYFRYRRWL